MTRYHGPFRWMSNFKAVAIDYEYYLTLSDKPQSVCLTERQMYVLSVQNTYTAWLTRWYNTDDITQKTVQFIAAEIEELLMCGCGVPVPSITDILNAQTYTTNTANSYITTYNTWNDAGQTVISIAPNLDYGTGDPANIDKLMCLGLNMLLVSIVEQAKSIKQGEIDDAKDLTKQLASAFGALGVAAGAATGVGGAAAAFVGFLGGPWLLLGLGLAAVGLTIASIVIPADLSVFTDAQAFEDVYCTMVNNLVGNEPTRVAFQAALTPNSFTPGSLAAQLAAIVQPYLDDLDMYLQFLVQMNGLYEVSNFTLLPECGCVPPVTLTPIIDPGGMWIGGSYNGTVGGALTDLGGGLWRGTPTLAGDGEYHLAIKDASGQDFKLVDLAITGSFICEGWKTPVGEFFDGCSSTEDYAGETLQTIWWIQNTANPGSYLEFRMVAP